MITQIAGSLFQNPCAGYCRWVNVTTTTTTTTTPAPTTVMTDEVTMTAAGPVHIGEIFIIILTLLLLGNALQEVVTSNSFIFLIAPVLLTLVIMAVFVIVYRIVRNGIERRRVRRDDEELNVYGIRADLWSSHPDLTIVTTIV